MYQNYILNIKSLYNLFSVFPFSINENFLWSHQLNNSLNISYHNTFSVRVYNFPNLIPFKLLKYSLYELSSAFQYLLFIRYCGKHCKGGKF